MPGALSGWSSLVETYGDLTLAEVLAPAIRLAEEGFPVSPIIAHDWAGAEERLARDPGAAATYLVDGQAPRVQQPEVRGDAIARFQPHDIAGHDRFRVEIDDGAVAHHGGAGAQELLQGARAPLGAVLLDPTDQRIGHDDRRDPPPR